MKKLFPLYSVLLIVPLLATCRASRATSSHKALQRHADSVATLQSAKARHLVRETVTETITVRLDSATGELRTMAKDIVRTSERATETEQTGDTARFSISEKENTDIEEKTRETQSNTAKTRHYGQIALWWLCIAFLATLLALYLNATWKSKN